MILNLIFASGLIICTLIGFGTWLSELRRASVSTLTVIPIAKAVIIPVVWVALCVLIVVTGFSVSISSQIDKMVG